MILAGMGADVLKIERPGIGDDTRQMAPVGEGSSAYFIAINRGKRSVCVDLSRGEGIALLLRMAPTCDVFIENFRGGKAEAMGLGEAALRAANPGIIYASLSAFGPTGPDQERPGYDALVQARTGIQSVTGEPGTAGARAGVSVLDMGSGMWVAMGVIAQLFDRVRTGAAGRVDGSLFQTGIMWMAYHLLAKQMTGRDPQPQGTRIGAFAPYGDYATSDGRILIGISNDRLFRSLCLASGLAPDPRFLTNPDRVNHRDALDAALAQILATRSTGEWLDRFHAAGVPASAVQNTGQILEDAQLAALGQMSEVPGLGVRSPLLPLQFSGAPAESGPVPRLGEHTRDVLIEYGCTLAEIDDLAQRRIIECPPQPKSSG
jgi:succinate--hydroxymethylglutarate CoA-transferase